MQVGVGGRAQCDCELQRQQSDFALFRITLRAITGLSSRHGSSLSLFALFRITLRAITGLSSRPFWWDCDCVSVTMPSAHFSRGAPLHSSLVQPSALTHAHLLYMRLIATNALPKYGLAIAISPPASVRCHLKRGSEPGPPHAKTHTCRVRT